MGNFNGEATEKPLASSELLAIFPSREANNERVKDWIKKAFEFRGLKTSKTGSQWVENVNWVGYELHDLPQRRLLDDTAYDSNSSPPKSARLIIETIVHFRECKKKESGNNNSIASACGLSFTFRQSRAITIILLAIAAMVILLNLSQF